jgi:nitronate monooxygenase
VPGMRGEIAELPLYAGQSAGLTRAVQRADELVETLSEETATALEDTP